MTQSKSDATEAGAQARLNARARLSPGGLAAIATALLSAVALPSLFTERYTFLAYSIFRFVMRAHCTREHEDERG